MRTLLRKTGVVDYPYRSRLQLPDHPSGQSLPHRCPVPGTLSHELLHRLFVAVWQPLGHGLNGFRSPSNNSPRTYTEPQWRRSLRPTGSSRSTKNRSSRFRHRPNWASVMPKHNVYPMFLSTLNGVILEQWDKERRIRRGSKYSGFTAERKLRFL